MKINQRRLERIRKTVANRQLDFTVVMEHFTDLHNMGAVLRSCEAVGIQNVHLIPHPESGRKRNVKLGKRTSAGARKWLNVFTHDNIDECFEYLRPKYQQILCTSLSGPSKSVYETDLTLRTAVILGNEKLGVSERAVQLSDGNLLIPMMGMMESLNVSVACSVILFEGMRQRLAAGKYSDELGPDKTSLYEDYLERHRSRYKGKKSKSMQ
ncbi:MAG: RNA methyltransferase [Saprospirales bacterium]|nr:MAG: RNA methyltransferase [Saprospirales bacterium]